MNRDYPFLTLDVFTDRRFGGNQLAVLPDASGLSDAQMLEITREFNYSESIFFERESETTFNARIFTPGGEIPFAGHPTVGGAIALALSGTIDERVNELTLREKLGPVPVTLERKSVAMRARFATPKVAAVEPRLDVPEETILRALGLERGDVDGRYPLALVHSGLVFTFVPLHRKAYERMQFDRGAWARDLAGSSSLHLYVFTPPDANGVVHSRCFLPGAGIEEDPATGSAAAALGAYLGKTAKENVLHFNVHQGDEMGRPSRIEVEAHIASGVVSKVLVSGAAVEVMRGTLLI